MRISIALASYQGARFISQQLDSFASQVRLPDEVCVSDDGSSDATLELVRAFAKAAPFTVKSTVNPVRGGVNKNFENAVTMCTGDVILFSDQDDVWLPQHVDQLVAPMEANPRIVAVASDSEFVDESLKSTGITQMQSDRFSHSLRAATKALPPNQFKLVLRQNNHSGHGMAFRRTLLPLLLPFTNTFMFDEWVLVLAASAGFRSHCIVNTASKPTARATRTCSCGQSSRKTFRRSRSECRKQSGARCWKECAGTAPCWPMLNLRKVRCRRNWTS
jgi:glycosyltransferase involved in cell wall biosynthesis